MQSINIITATASKLTKESKKIIRYNYILIYFPISVKHSIKFLHKFIQIIA
jgi:hypothetical protein